MHDFHRGGRVTPGLRKAALSGANALVELDGTEAAFVVNLSRLTGRSMVPGNFCTSVPALQEVLF